MARFRSRFAGQFAILTLLLATAEGQASKKPSEAELAALAVHEHVPNYIETPAGLIHEIDGTHATSVLTAPQYTWPVGGPIP
jgi:hypothetical protein